MNKRETVHTITFTEVYVRITNFFGIYIFNWFHKSGGKKVSSLQRVKEVFLMKVFFFSRWNTVMYMLAQTAWLHISCVSKKYTSAYGVMLCFSCAAKCRYPGNSVVCDGVLCKFLVQSQLAYSGSKLQLNSGKLTDLIRKSWITLLSLQPIKLIPISEHAEANLPVFSRTARLCLITIFPSCPSW